MQREIPGQKFKGNPMKGLLLVVIWIVFRVVAALEILRRYSGERKSEKTVYAVNWADEEGARFGRSLLGSSAASGALDVGEIIGCVDNEGTGIVEALRKYDVDLHNIQWPMHSLV
jgi:hypothetical protein